MRTETGSFPGNESKNTTINENFRGAGRVVTRMLGGELQREEVVAEAVPKLWIFRANS